MAKVQQQQQMIVNGHHNGHHNGHQQQILKERTIGRWRIGSTLGKGGYSWVKKGHDKKTNKCVALKFMRKADKSWEKEQTKQVVTEIECLKQIRHINVLKLYAYNLNAKYPTSNKYKNPQTGQIEYKKIDTILLVLEYAPGGEIFDILYYTHALESVLARTYFRQAIFGLEACHNAGIAHRDIKAQNLLLDSRFNLKICDFGLSKIFESDSDSVMKTSYVGTRGYQAPELLLNKTYNSSCDIFSLGVVLFILINGYPPFEQAIESDRWFNPLVNGDNKKFWKLHRQCKIRKDDKCKDMLSKMLAFDAKKRITINQLKKHPWFNGKYLEGKNLIKVLRHRHKEMERKRREDGRKLADLQTSIQHKAIPLKFGNVAECDYYPNDMIEGVNDNEQYSHEGWKEILYKFNEFIGKNYGKCHFNVESKHLECAMELSNPAMNNQTQKVKFDIKVFKSRDYQYDTIKQLIANNESKNNDDINNDDNQDDIKQNNDDITINDGYDNNDSDDEAELIAQENQNKKQIVYIVSLQKKDGNTDKWITLRNQMLTHCASVITGLPQWAQNVDIDVPDINDDNNDDANNNDNNNDNNNNNDDDDVDEYDQILNADDLWE